MSYAFYPKVRNSASYQNNNQVTKPIIYTGVQHTNPHMHFFPKLLTVKEVWKNQM